MIFIELFLTKTVVAKIVYCSLILLLDIADFILQAGALSDRLQDVWNRVLLLILTVV